MTGGEAGGGAALVGKRLVLWIDLLGVVAFALRRPVAPDDAGP
jgi:hypothetical protein